jgi:3-methyl-2-oxobutanoate hydroxymethyltransferase
MLGLFSDFTPKFVKRYANIGEQIQAAARAYADEVRTGAFPAPEHTYQSRRNRAGPAVFDDKTS